MGGPGTARHVMPIQDAREQFARFRSGPVTIPIPPLVLPPLPAKAIKVIPELSAWHKETQAMLDSWRKDCITAVQGILV